MNRQARAIARPWLGKGRVCPRIETEPQFCSTPGVWGANPPCEPGVHEPNRAFRSLALGAAAIPGSPANHGLYSTRAIGVSWRAFLGTSPFLSAIFAPAGQPNSLRASSPSPILAAFVRNTVFTRTHNASPERHICSLAFVMATRLYVWHTQMLRRPNDAGGWSQGRREI